MEVGLDIRDGEVSVFKRRDMKGGEEMGKRFMRRQARKELEGKGFPMRRSGGEVGDEAEWR
jgi:hypothetical protein